MLDRLVITLDREMVWRKLFFNFMLNSFFNDFVARSLILKCDIHEFVKNL